MPGAVHSVGWPMAIMEHDLIGVSIHGNNAIMIDIPLCFVCGFVGATHASPVMGRW